MDVYNVHALNGFVFEFVFCVLVSDSDEEKKEQGERSHRMQARWKYRFVYIRRTYITVLFCSLRPMLYGILCEMDSTIYYGIGFIG